MTDPFKTGGYVHISPPMMIGSDALEAEFQRGMRRTFTPWEFPDRNPFPIIDPVPTYTSLVTRTCVMADRVISAWQHLRHGDCNHNHEW